MRPVPVILATLFALPALAQDFSEGSTANPWNLYAEQPAFFEARVVDALCALTGDCPEDCGDGRRQLALIRSADDVMVLPLKNGQPAFTGAVEELLPFCGQTVEVDGLLLDDPDLGAQNVYLVQKIRTAGSEEWTDANRWTSVWTEEHPDAAGDGPWFRRDPQVLSEIEEEGYFGLGPERDAEIIDELFQ